MPDKFKGVLKLLAKQLTLDLMNKKKLPQEKALKALYSSKVYELLEQEDTKLWHLSDVALYDMLEKELDGEEIAMPEEV